MRVPALAWVSFIAWIAACNTSSVSTRRIQYTVKLNEQYGHLTNGVKVILLPDRSSPLVEVDVRYVVGSKEDPRGKSGLAHLVEHLLFLHRPAPGEPSLGAALRERSLYYNAMTSWDYTHYQTLARAEDVAAVIALEGVRLARGCEGISLETFEREREVVRNELRQRSDSPDGRLYNQLLRSVYGPEHAYGRPIGGSDAEVTAATLEDACRFVRDYYVPERATVVVAGNFEEAKVQSLLAQHLGAVPKRAGAPLVPVTPVDVDGRRETVSLAVDRESVAVAWPLPPRFGPLAFESATLPSVVADAAGTVFYDDADDARVMIIGGAQAPVLVALAYLKKGHDAAKTGWGIVDAADRARHGTGFGTYALQAYKQELVGDIAAELENLAERAAVYADYAQFAPRETFATQVQRLTQLDDDSIDEVAERTLHQKRAMILTVARKRGATEAEVATGFSTPADERDELPVDGRQAGQSITLPPAPTNTAGARRFQLANGMQVVLLPTTAPMPVVTAKLTFAAGSAHEPKDKRGLAYLAGMAYARRVRTFRFGFSPQVNPDSTEITGSVSSLYVDDIIDAFGVFEDDFRTRVTRVKDMQKALKALKQHRAVGRAAQVSSALGKAVYGASHPYAVAFDPLVAASADVDQGDIQDFFKKHYTAANATLIVTGVFEADAVEKRIRDKLGGWDRGRTTPPIVEPAPRVAGPAVYAVPGHDDDSQVQVRVAWATPPGHDAGYAARLVLAEMLDRRVAAVRERLGASYGVFAAYAPAVGPGVMVVGGSVDAARAGQALAAMRTGVDEIRRGEGFLEDFVRARAAVLHRLVANGNDSSSLAERLATMATFALPPGYFDDLAAQIARLAPKDVLALARKELDPTAEVIVAEGPKPALEMMYGEVKLTPKVPATASR